MDKKNNQPFPSETKPETKSQIQQTRARSRTVMLNSDSLGQFSDVINSAPEAGTSEFKRPARPDPVTQIISTNESEWMTPNKSEKNSDTGVGIEALSSTANQGAGKFGSRTDGMSQMDKFLQKAEAASPEKFSQPVEYPKEYAAKDPVNSLITSTPSSVAPVQQPSSNLNNSRPDLRQRQGSILGSALGGNRGTFDEKSAPPEIQNSELVERARRASIVPTQKAPKTRLVGFLVSYDTDEIGQFFEIRAGRIIITSRPTEQGDFMLIRDESISPLHAILKATVDGKINILDQLSENGTYITKLGEAEEVDCSGVMSQIEHGDTLRLGSRSFTVCIVPKRN